MPTKPGALNVMNAVRAPSAAVFSGSGIVSSAEVEPDGIVTDEGAFAVAGSELVMFTVTGPVEPLGRYTYAVAVPPSERVPKKPEKVSGLLSSSCTITFALAVVQPGALAVMPAVRAPFTMKSLMMVNVKLAETCPAGRVTPVGTVITDVLLLASVIVRAFAEATLAVTVPVPLPPLSITSAGSVSVSAPPSSSCTVRLAVLRV